MKHELVSIIMPAYNVEKYIHKSIESVINQTYDNWELLIMDDFSKDNTWDVIKKYAEKDNRIKIIKAEKNNGVTFIRNHLTNISNGKYISFLDSDDVWRADKLKLQLDFMKKNDASISCTNYIRMTEDEKEINIVEVKEKISLSDLLKNNYLGCSTVMYNAKKLGKKHFKEIEKNEDYLLWLEIIKTTNYIYGLKENLTNYRIMQSSRSSNKFKVIKVRWNIYRKHEKLSFIKSVYYFLIYIKKAFGKNVTYKEK